MPTPPYMLLYKEISAATASRDLAEAVAKGVLSIRGEKSKAKYKFRKMIR